MSVRGEFLSEQQKMGLLTLPGTLLAGFLGLVISLALLYRHKGSDVRNALFVMLMSGLAFVEVALWYTQYQDGFGSCSSTNVMLTSVAIPALISGAILVSSATSRVKMSNKWWAFVAVVIALLFSAFSCACTVFVTDDETDDVSGLMWGEGMHPLLVLAVYIAMIRPRVSHSPLGAWFKDNTIAMAMVGTLSVTVTSFPSTAVLFSVAYSFDYMRPNRDHKVQIETGNAPIVIAEPLAPAQAEAVEAILANDSPTGQAAVTTEQLLGQTGERGMRRGMRRGIYGRNKRTGRRELVGVVTKEDGSQKLVFEESVTAVSSVLAAAGAGGEEGTGGEGSYPPDLVVGPENISQPDDFYPPGRFSEPNEPTEVDLVIQEAGGDAVVISEDPNGSVVVTDVTADGTALVVDEPVNVRVENEVKIVDVELPEPVAQVAPELLQEMLCVPIAEEALVESGRSLGARRRVYRSHQYRNHKRAGVSVNVADFRRMMCYKPSDVPAPVLPATDGSANLAEGIEVTPTEDGKELLTFPDGTTEVVEAGTEVTVVADLPNGEGNIVIDQPGDVVQVLETDNAGNITGEKTAVIAVEANGEKVIEFTEEPADTAAASITNILNMINPFTSSVSGEVGADIAVARNIGLRRYARSASRKGGRRTLRRR